MLQRGTGGQIKRDALTPAARRPLALSACFAPARALTLTPDHRAPSHTTQKTNKTDERFNFHNKHGAQHRQRSGSYDRGRPRHNTYNVGDPSRFGNQGGNFFDNLGAPPMGGTAHGHSRYSAMTSQQQPFYPPARKKKEGPTPEALGRD